MLQRRRPALLDNPIYMLISPMSMFAKLFIVLGFRRDLAARGSPLAQREDWADSDQYP